MCGITGMAGNLIALHDKIIRTMLVLDSVRGEHSTGLAGVGKFDGTVRVSKQLGDPFQLFQDKRFENTINKVNKVFIGHNRYATSGGISRATAHPFEFDTLVGVHNGTLSSKHKLIDAEDFKVDSENLYWHIEQKGIDDAIKQLGGYGNAWALVWWDKATSSLNLLRNEERPLYLCRDDKGVMYWASEPWMLIASLGREGIKYTDPFLMEANLLHTIHVNNQGELSKPSVRRVQAPKPPVTVVQNVHSNAAANQSNVTKIEDAKKESTTFSSGCDNTYLGAKGVVLEALEVYSDTNGAAFVSCFDEKHPYKEIRLYINKGDKFGEWVDKKFTGDIMHYVPYSTPGKGYYKVSPHSAILIEENNTTKLYLTHKGSMVTKSEWERQYGDCSWCASPLFVEDENIFTTAGQCLCPSCAKDPMVTQHVHLIH